MKKKWTIYQHINKINNKRYIGQTCLEPERRWRKDGSGYQDSPIFYKAIQKYGWNNFSHEIIEVGDSEEWANERERYWIAYYDTFNNPDKGYNMTPGGSNYMHELWQDEKYRSKMSESFSRSRKEQWQNEEYAKERLQPMLDGIQRVWNDPEWRKNRIEKITGDKNPNAKAVKNLETGRIFATIKEATKWAGLNSASCIGECCRGNKKSAGTHPETGVRLHWVFVSKEEVV